MSSSASRTSSVLTVAAITVLGGLFAYAVYFDYKRRNDSDFRKKLRKDKKKVTKQTQKEQAAAESASEVSPAEIKETLFKLRAEEVPATPQAKEEYFMAQIQIGDQLVQRGPAFHLAAATTFFRALRVYPSPVEFIVMLQQSLSPPIFSIFMEFVNADIAAKIEDYWEHFPSKKMNVSVKSGPSEDKQPAKKTLVAEKDFAEGEVIYTESPFVVTLDADLEGKGTHCSFCFRPVDNESALTISNDKLSSVFCSETCKTKAHAAWQNILHALDPALPPELDPGMSEEALAARGTAANEYTEWVKTPAPAASVLVARFIAKQIGIETQKMGTTRVGDLDAELNSIVHGDGSYSCGDHLERLRFLEGKVSDDEVRLLKSLIAAVLPGAEESIIAEQYAMLVGKMAYNLIGITPDGGRDDKPESTERPEDQERTRTPHGTAKQLGSGLYFVSSYLGHSCDPTARPTFTTGSTALTLVAARPIAKGEELTISWVDSSTHEGESTEDARRRRRVELARGWKFKCECARCVSEAVADLEREAAEEAELGVKADESRVDDVVKHENVHAPGEDAMGLD